jgi:outer membrane biosynthesis protein TonB
MTDTMDHSDPVGRAFLGALGLHIALLAGLLVTGWLAKEQDSFGSKNAGGAAVGVEVVNSIPLVHHGAPNPLANDSQSEVPQAPVTKPVERVKEEKPPPDAIPIKSPKTKKAPEASEKQRFRPINELQPNQLTSKSAPQVSSPQFTATPGSGQIGAGKSSLEGTIYAGYGDQIRGIIARNWRTGDVDAQLRSAPIVTANFDLMRDGSIGHLQLTQRSGNFSLDASVQRAIQDSKFPPLPQGYPHDHATVEFSFELKR